MVTETRIESPDSIPSIADTSMGSSSVDDGDGDNGEVVDLPPRRLFYRVEDIKVPLACTLPLCSIHRGEELNTNVVHGSEVSTASTTSSQSTAVAAWNLTMKESPDGKVQLPTNNCEQYLDNMLDVEYSDISHSEEHIPEFFMEEPPEETTSCHGPLTTRQLAELLVAFQGRKMWASRSNECSEMDSTSTSNETPIQPPPTTPREKILLRQCTALKKIIQEDSIKVVKLRRALEALQEMNTLKDIEIEDKEVELQIAMDRIDALKREKEVLREREDELMDTIEILKREVDKLSTWESQKNDMTEGQVLCFHSKQTSLEETEKDNQQSSRDAKLILELHTNDEGDLQDHNETSAESKISKDELFNPLPLHPNSNELVALSLSLQEIAKRLDALVKDKLDTANTGTFLESLEKTNTQTDGKQQTLYIKNHDGTGQSLLKIAQDPDEVEVLLLKDTKKQRQVDSPCSSAICCWDVLSINLEDHE